MNVTHGTRGLGEQTVTECKSLQIELSDGHLEISETEVAGKFEIRASNTRLVILPNVANSIWLSTQGFGS